MTKRINRGRLPIPDSRGYVRPEVGGQRFIVVLLAGIVGTTFGLIQTNQKTQLAERKSQEALQERANAVESEKRAKQ